MVTAIAQIVNGRGASSARKKKRTTIKPACVGSILMVMYVVFIVLVLIMLEDGPIMDSGAAYHLNNIVTPVKPTSKNLGSVAKEVEKEVENENSDFVHFCGECRWKDTLYDCNERVAWEMENKESSEIEAKKTNLIYCTKPIDMHVSDFCGECKWKDMPFDCNERVAWEVIEKKLSTIEAQRRNLMYCKRPAYILSPLCGECVRTLTNMTSKMYRDGIPCYDLMLRRMKQGTVESAVDAARKVAEEFQACRSCHPETCWKSYFDELSMSVEGLGETNKGYLTKYWRFDQAAPKITSPMTLTLPSIPKDFRIPPSRFADIDKFLTEKFNEFEANNDTSHVPIFIEYNPGLAPIPPKMKKYLPRYATYAVVFRVTPANNCFRREDIGELPKRVWEHTMMSATNLLGIALLDAEYEILKGYDVVVDIATQLGLQKDGYGTTYFGEPTFMDYRLFTLNDAIYLHANADTTVVTKLDLRSKEHGTKPKSEQFKLDIVYGEDNLEVTLLHQFNTIWSGGDRGKNFALFAIPNSTHPYEPDSVYAEIDINPSHNVQQVYLDEVEMLKRIFIKKRVRRNYAVDKIAMRKVKEIGNMTTSEIEPSPSFFTVDEHWVPGSRPAFRRAGHGGACCIPLSRREALAQGEHVKLAQNSWGENDYLLVGVAHTSVTWRRWYADKHVPDSEKALIPHTHYVSFFYAFEPRPPFHLRARSGYFCLGFAGEDGTEGGTFNPHSTLTINRKLSQHNETFACPQIHFVASFIEKVDEPSTTVIGYGINDCTPRLVEVSKKEITRMLFSDPWDMKIDKSVDFGSLNQTLELRTPMDW